MGGVDVKSTESVAALPGRRLDVEEARRDGALEVLDRAPQGEIL